MYTTKQRNEWFSFQRSGEIDVEKFNTADEQGKTN